MYLACGDVFGMRAWISKCRQVFDMWAVFYMCTCIFLVVMNFAHVHVVFGGHMHVFALC